MLCPRCSGLMIAELLYDLNASANSVEAPATRCLNCGNIEDAIIHINRLEPRSVRRAALHNLGVQMHTSSTKTEHCSKRADELTT